MISAAQWRAYNDAVAAITDTAREQVRGELAEWLSEHDGVTVAEAREAARRILSANAGVYNQSAAALAAEWYDAQGKAAGMKLDRAVTSVTVDRDSLSKTVRYQAQKFVDGNLDEFCDAVGEWAENEAKRALNATIMKNVGRDKRKGVKFARVTSGRNTCAFCLMLASRGAIYHTRQSAGELGQYHRHCNCKIVPCYSGNQYEVLVEGHDPKDALSQWRRIDSKTVITDSLYELGREEISAEADYLDKLAKSAPKTGYEELTRLLSSSGTVAFERGSVPNCKELQVAKWLASVGWDPTFRNELRHLETDGNTSDLLMLDETWDIKRITSGNPNKIAQAIFKKERQGPNYVIDLSLSDMSEDDALTKCASILDDDRVHKIALIVSKKLLVMKK